MSETMKFTLVSPLGIVASSDASEVDLPVTEGDMTAMPHHAALIGTLKPGIIRAGHQNEVSEFVITGGFVEVNEGTTTVLAEDAYRRQDVTSEICDSWITKATEEVGNNEGARRDALETRLAGMKTLRAELNL